MNDLVEWLDAREDRGADFLSRKQIKYYYKILFMYRRLEQVMWNALASLPGHTGKYCSGQSNRRFASTDSSRQSSSKLHGIICVRLVDDDEEFRRMLRTFRHQDRVQTVWWNMAVAKSHRIDVLNAGIILKILCWIQIAPSRCLKYCACAGYDVRCRQHLRLGSSYK